MQRVADDAARNGDHATDQHGDSTGVVKELQS
jgi:hypothetical protein